MFSLCPGLRPVRICGIPVRLVRDREFLSDAMEKSKKRNEMRLIQGMTRLVLWVAAVVAGQAVIAQQEPGGQAGNVPVQTPQVQQGQAAGASLESRFSLMFGYDTLMQFRERGIEVDVEELCRGIRMAAAGEPSPFSKEESMACAQQFGQKVQAAEAAMMQKQGMENVARGEAFMKENSAVPGVQVLPSGVHYRVIQAGTGATPTAEDTVQVHYAGKLVDGTPFDSSAGGPPASFPVSGVIRGMTECLLKMKVGEKCQMVIPAELAYGADAPDQIGPNQTLVFDVELVAIEPKR